MDEVPGMQRARREGENILWEERVYEWQACL